MTEQEFTGRAAAEFASVAGAMIGVEGQAAAGAQPGEWAYVIRVVFGGKVTGAATFAVAAAPAATLSRLVMGLDEAPPEPAIVDTLKELFGQAVGGLTQQPELQGLRVIDAVLEVGAPSGTPTCFSVSAGPSFDAVIGIWALLDLASRVAPEPPAAVSPAPPRPSNLDVILDIDLPLAVRFGETEMTLHRLARLGPGSVIDLGRAPDDPVDILVSGRLVARGEVVVIGGNYGVRVIEVISAADRWRTVTA